MLTKVSMNTHSQIFEYEHSFANFEVVLRFDAKNALALYARGLTLLKMGSAEAGAADIAAAKSINPNIAEQFDHSKSSARSVLSG